MSKGLKTFTKIIYYIFTFVMGIVIAVILPFQFLLQYLPEDISNKLVENKYAEALGEIYGGGYYNSEILYQETLADGSGFVIFEAETLIYDVEGVADGSKLRHSYAGFLYNVKDKYHVSKTSDNQTKLNVKDGVGNISTYEFLDSDTNDDESKDDVSLVEVYGYVYFNITQDISASVKEISFVDCDNNVYQQITFTSALDYTGTFFSDVQPFVDEYNVNNSSEALQTLNNEFKAKSDKYQMFSYTAMSKKANYKSITIVIIYFLIIYILGDILLGKRLVIKLFKWFLFKVLKIKRKNQEVVNEDEVLGTDYLSTVTFSIDRSECPEFNTVVSLSYTKDKETLEVSLYKDEDYKAVRKIKAGIYVNPFVRIDGNYEIDNLPSNLNVKGYTMQINLKLKKVERNR